MVSSWVDGGFDLARGTLAAQGKPLANITLATSGKP